MRLEVIGAESLPEPRRITIGQTLRDGEQGPWLEVEGNVILVREQPDGCQMELSAGAGRMQVEVAGIPGPSSASWLYRRVQTRGFCQAAFTTDGQEVAGRLLVPNEKAIEPIQDPLEITEAGPRPGGLPVLRTAAEVHRLKREEAQKEYPVKIRVSLSVALRSADQPPSRPRAAPQ